MNYTPCGYKNYTKEDMERVGHSVARSYDFFLKDIWYSVKHKTFFVQYVSGDECYDAQIKPDYFDLVHHRMKGGTL